MTAGRLPRITGVLAALLALAAAARAQTPEIVTPDSLLAGPESEGLDSLQVRMERGGWTSALTGHVFRSRSDGSELGDGVDWDPAQRFREWAGRPVRHVIVERINVFTPNPVGTPSEDAGRLARLGNALHLDSQEFVIRGFVLQEEGEPLNVRALVDTERLLRGTPYIVEADIEIIPVEGSDEVDVIVLTRDRWTIGARVKVSSPTRWTLQLFERNLLGRGVDWTNRFDVNTTREVGERADYTGRMFLENWRGWFINWEAAYQSRRETESTALGISRTADIPEVRWVGHVRGAFTRTREVSPHRFQRQDVWLGRDLFTRDPGDGSGVSRLFVHVRSLRTEFIRRPAVAPDSLRGLHDEVWSLGTVSWSKRRFRRDRLVLQWGRTEDIPVGYRLKLTGGYRWGEFEKHPYLGIELRQADFHSLGYFTWVAEAGGFLRDGKVENGALGGWMGWYGHLWKLASLRVRPLASLRAEHVFRTLENTGITIGGDIGPRGLPLTQLGGNSRFYAATEVIAFTRLAPWGFRFAFFGNAGAGTVAVDPKYLAINRWFSQISLGLRIFNEHLVFDAIELAVAFYPSAPSGVEGEAFYFGTTRPLRIPDFNLDPPRIVRVR